MVEPGGKLPTGEELPSGTADGAPPTPSPTPATLKEPSQAHGLSGGAIAGIVIGAVAVCAILVTVSLFFGSIFGGNRKEVQYLRRDVHVEQRKSMRLGMKTANDDRLPKSPMISYDPDLLAFAQQSHQSNNSPPYTEHTSGSMPMTAELPPWNEKKHGSSGPLSDGGEPGRNMSVSPPMELVTQGKGNDQ